MIAQKINHSKVFTRTLNAKTRHIVHEGSSRSSKTYSLCQYLIYRALKSLLIINIFRAKLTWAKATVMIDFFDVLTNHYKIYNPAYHNKQDATYRFPNGSLIRFVGADETQRLHGLKGDIAWINECMEVAERSYRQIALRTSQQVIMDFNPSEEDHYVFSKIIPRDDCTHIHSTYKDNPFLEQAIIEEIERLEPNEFNLQQGTADETLWKIYGLGQRASHKGLIFPEIKICKELPPKETWKKCFYGLDFGYSNDVTAFVRIVLSQGELFFQQLIYERKLINCINHKHPDKKSIEGEFKHLKIGPSEPIYADSAEPKSIAELQLAGYNVQATTKGQDSIVNGINQINQYNAYITEDSVDMIKEKNNYKWKEDPKTGELLNIPVDAFNHCWDAGRYGCLKELPHARNKPYRAQTPHDMANDKTNFKNVFEEIQFRDRIKDQTSYYE